MNPNYDNPGYRAAALMAVLERLQSAALGQVNTTLVDRYFSAASSTPRMIFVRLLRNAQHHARKARDSDDKRDRDVAFLCGRVIDWIADRFDVRSQVLPPTHQRAAAAPGPGRTGPFRARLPPDALLALDEQGRADGLGATLSRRPGRPAPAQSARRRNRPSLKRQSLDSYHPESLVTLEA